MWIIRIVTTHPKSVAAAAVLAVLLVWQAREWRTRAALRDLPTVDTDNLEPGMSEIINQHRAAVASAPFSARAWGTYGSVLLAQEYVADAVICYARAEQLDPHQIRWPYLHGLCLERQDPDTAMACFRRAARIRDDLVLPKVQLAEMLLSRDELREADAHLRLAVAMAPRDSRVLLCMGRLAFMRNKLDEALHWTTQAAQFDPQRRRIRLLICQIQQRRGDEAAVEEQLRILESIPETGSDNEWPDPFLQEIAQYKRGTMWTLQVVTQQIFAGRFNEAIELLQRSGGNDAADARLIVLLGNAYLRSEQFDKAAETLARAREKDPASAPVHFELGNLAMVSARWNEAAEYYRETIRLQPDFSSAHYNLGLCHQRRGEQEQAIAAFCEACRYAPNNFPAHRELAELLLEAGRREEAIAHLKTASKLVPNDPKLLQLIDRERDSSTSLP